MTDTRALEDPRFICTPINHRREIDAHGECGSCGEIGTPAAYRCYFCDTPVPGADLVKIYVPAVDQSVTGRVCVNDLQRLAIREAQSKDRSL